MQTTFITALVLAVAATGAAAQDAPPETAVLGTATVTVYPQPFLSEPELMTLRAVMTNEQALTLFVGEKGGHAALAVSPVDGFIRDGQPTVSAVAIGGHDDSEKARADALQGCNAKKTGGPDCVVVLTVSPQA